MSVTPRSPRIPLSPSSPPETGLKRRRPSDPSVKPLSPPYMSVATKSYVSSYGHTSHSDKTASRSSPRSPSSSSSYIQQVTQRGSQPYSTPVSSTGIPGLSMMEDIDQHRDKRQKMEVDRHENADTMEVERTTQPTNHNRNADVKVEEEKEEKEEEEEDKIVVDSDNTTLDQLQEDMGDAFLLGRSKLQHQGPNPSSHLLGIYGLVPLLKTVIRTDPVTGEKINKLRKSYEGQIKTFGMSGRNKPVKTERQENEASNLRQSVGSGLKEFPDDPNEAQGPLQSDEVWALRNAHSKVQVTPDLRAKLKKAMELQPGRVRNIERWDEVLGHDKPRTNVPTPAQTTAPAASQRLPNGVLRPQLHASSDLKRQTRGKKRSYGDDSFIGYGDGYSDVEDAGAVDDYGDDEGGSRRKRRKDSMGGPLTYGQTMGW